MMVCIGPPVASNFLVMRRLSVTISPPPKSPGPAGVTLVAKTASLCQFRYPSENVNSKVAT